LSSTKVEYIVVATRICEAMWIKKLLLEIRMIEKNPTLICCDNQSSIKLKNNPMFHARSKHIETRYHFIRDLIQKKDIYMDYCSIEHNVVDILTKSLPIPKFEYCRIGLGMCVPSTILKREC
jgi:hypothetical protein